MTGNSADIDLGDIEKRCAAHWDRCSTKEAPRNFIQISDKLGVKIGGRWSSEPLYVLYEWLKYLAPLVDSTKVIIPRPWGPPIKFNGFTLLLMDYVPGQTVAQYLQTTNGILDDRTADNICNAYLALRTITANGDEIYPGEKSWPVCGHIYSMDNEAGLNVTSREQFNTYMDDRLTMAHGNKKTTLSRTKVMFCY